jgi:hypothetical protein
MDASLMQKGARGEARLHVDASPDQLYRMVSDVTRMGEWSPETVGCRWIDGASGPAVGARFKGFNRRGFVRWSTTPEVVVAESGREFAFVTKRRGFPSTRWTYTFTPAPTGGTDLAETFELLGDYSWLAGFLVRRVVWTNDDRRADLEAGLMHTLQRIKAVAEAR